MPNVLEIEIEPTIKDIPDINNIQLPYIVKDQLLLTVGKWNGKHFTESCLCEASQALANDPESYVRLYEGAAMDHQDSTGTLIGESRNHTYKSGTLRGDLYFITAEGARKAKWAHESNHSLQGISPRMSTDPPWTDIPLGGNVGKITEFKSFGIVLDPAQGKQAMLRKDSKGREILDDSPYLILDADDGVGNKDGSQNHKEVKTVKMLHCKDCGFLFNSEAVKCVECNANLLEADAEVVKRLEAKLAAHTLGSFLRASMEEKDVSAEQMGSEAGISGSTVNQILSGSIMCPPINRLEGFAKALGMSLSSIREKAEADGCEYDDAGMAISCPIGKEPAPEAKLEYPNPTYKDKPYYQNRNPYAYKSPFYGKTSGEFHKTVVPIQSFVFLRKMALDQVSDLADLQSDIVGCCGEILKLSRENNLDLEKAIMDLSMIIAEIPQAAELSKEDVQVDDVILGLIKKNEESEKKAIEAEYDAIDKAKKLPPAVRDEAIALLSVSSDAVLSNDGKALDIAGFFRKIIEHIGEGAALALNKEGKLVSKDAKLQSGEEEKTSAELKKSGAELVPPSMRSKDTELEVK